MQSNKIIKSSFAIYSKGLYNPNNERMALKYEEGFREYL